MAKTGVGGQAGVGSTLGAAQARRYANMIVKAIKANGTPKQKSIWTTPKVYKKLEGMTLEQAKKWHARTVGPKAR